jgi:small-conductance mechanosensitive channel
MTSLREAGFKLSVFLGAAGILTVALGFASQTSATNLISGLFLKMNRFVSFFYRVHRTNLFSLLAT